MNKNYILMGLLLSLIAFGWSCKEEYEVPASNERAILLAKAEKQIGVTVISRTSDLCTATLTVEPSVSLTSVALSFVVSKGATISPASGTALDFTASGDSSYTYTVTAESGLTRQWKVYVRPFVETLLGTWEIDKLVVYGGTGPEYGGAAVLEMTSKPWCWSASNGPAAEYDNTLTFEYTGFTPDGNTYGTVTNDAGTDGRYADFIFIPTDPDIDVNHFYRKIPRGSGTWLRNYTTGTITITFPDQPTSTAIFRKAGTYELGNGKTKVVADNALEFALSGTDDWGNIYKDIDKFVKRPRKYWIDIHKIQ